MRRASIEKGNLRRLLNIPPRAINIGVWVFLLYSIQCVQCGFFHTTRQVVHVQLCSCTNRTIVPSSLVDGGGRVPCDIWAGPSAVEVDIVEERTPERVQ